MTDNNDASLLERKKIETHYSGYNTERRKR